MTNIIISHHQKIIGHKAVIINALRGYMNINSFQPSINFEGNNLISFTSKPDDVANLMKRVGGVRLIIKLLEGIQGINDILTETKKAAESVIEAFMGLKAHIMVQEYIEEAGGADIR